MNYLAIDTSNKNLTVVASYNGKTVYFNDDNCGVNHSVTLMPETEKLLQSINFNLKDADFIACVVGPGSFTGIRIGISTVKAMCFAFNLPFLAITSLDTLAYNKSAGKVMAVIDAGHNGFYACGYNGGKITVTPRYILKDELLSYKEEYAFLSCDKIEGIDTEIVSVCNGLINAIAENSGKTNADLDELSPLYLRKSQAEEGRP